MTIIRFWAKVKKNGPIPTHRPELGQCWMWPGSQTNGYGKFIHRGRAIYAHRFAFESVNGTLGKLQIHHLCGNTLCVNPAHLQAVTPQNHPGAAPEFQRNKTHCPKGHPYSAENTYNISRGDRSCKICHKAQWAKKR